MFRVLEFVLWYVWYTIMGFIGVWLGSLIMGVDTNPFTIWIPYVIALILSLYEVIIND